jgi:hypothetical protein
MPRALLLPAAAVVVGLVCGSCHSGPPRWGFEIPVCAADGSDCACMLAGWTLCGSRCVNLQFDRDDCGECGHSCGSQVCDQGRCVDACSGSAGACSGSCTYADDPFNCGGCGVACDRGCRGGACVPDVGCGDGRAWCHGTCIDVMTDRNNCGACGRACTSTQACAKGTCS